MKKDEKLTAFTLSQQIGAVDEKYIDELIEGEIYLASRRKTEARRRFAGLAACLAAVLAAGAILLFGSRAQIPPKSTGERITLSTGEPTAESDAGRKEAPPPRIVKTISMNTNGVRWTVDEFLDEIIENIDDGLVVIIPVRVTDTEYFSETTFGEYVMVTGYYYDKTEERFMLNVVELNVGDPKAISVSAEKIKLYADYHTGRMMSAEPVQS
ncbi:MAG: hypothetical protein IJV00_01540 [Clostridia bacterium]|nr:hypothetical protein [Clostridia bacterium]